MNNENGSGYSDYIKVGTKQEKWPLVLENVLSYDEIKLSAFLSITSYTEFLNVGNRCNNGIIERDLNRIEREGIVIGLIGGRFQREEAMEYQDIVINKVQNVTAKGYGGGDKCSNKKGAFQYRKLWMDFYNEECDHLYEEVLKDQDNPRYSIVSPVPLIFFDNIVMKKRYALSFDTLLLEAQYRARQAGRQAYIHIVGIGLGVWRISEQQVKVFLETFHQRVLHLLGQLMNIGVLHFSWFGLTEWHELKDNGFIISDRHPDGGIRTFLSNRNPNEKLPMAYKNMLPIVSYAWDGNALPGNEFWLKSLNSSNDPSTACSTLITELHNPHINDIWVNGNNLHIASLEFGVLHLSDYVKKIESQL